MREQNPTACRGVRGAITVDEGPGALRRATGDLLNAIVEANGCDLEQIAAAIFTLADDLAGANPAAAARDLGWSSVPLLVVKESGVDPSPIGRCLRVLVLWNTERSQQQVRHVYLGAAAGLRPDLTSSG